MIARIAAGLGALIVVATSSAWAQTGPSTASQVTFTKDIAPILQRSCQHCPNPEGVAPMPLMTYEDARPWARAIRQKVVSGEMPPYRYDRNVGIQDLKFDLRLSDAEIQTIARWADNGAPLGNPSDLPPPITFPDPAKWTFADQFGPPDVIVRSKPFTLPASGQDAVSAFATKRTAQRAPSA